MYLPSYQGFSPYQCYYIPEQYQKPRPLRQEPVKSIQQESTYKTDILGWMKTLSSAQLFDIFQIHKKETVYCVIKMYHNDILNVPSQYALHRDTGQELDKKFIVRQRTDKLVEKLQTEQELFRKLLLRDVSGLFDTLCFHPSVFEDLDGLIHMLEVVSDHHIFSTTAKIQSTPKCFQVEDPIWFNPSSFQPCWYWIVNELEKQIAIEYHTSNGKYCVLKKKNTKSEVTKHDEHVQIVRYWIHLDRAQRKVLQGQSSDILKKFREQALNIDPKQDVEPEAVWFWMLGSMTYSSRVKLIADTEVEHAIKGIFDPRQEHSMVDLFTSVPLSRSLDQLTFVIKQFVKVIEFSFRQKMIDDIVRQEESEKQKSGSKSKRNRKKKHKQPQKDTEKPIENAKKVDYQELIQILNTETVTEKRKCFVTPKKSFIFQTPPNSPFDMENQTSPLRKQEIESSEIEMQELHIYNPLNFGKIINEMLQLEPRLGCTQTAVELKLPEDETTLTQTLTRKLMDCYVSSFREEEEYNHEMQAKQKEKKKQQKKLMKKSQKNASLSLNLHTQSERDESPNRNSQPLTYDQGQPTSPRTDDNQQIVGKEDGSWSGVRESLDSSRNSQMQQEEIQVLSKSHQTNTTTAPTSEEEMLKIYSFNQKKNCKSGNQEFNAYQQQSKKAKSNKQYKPYHIRSDQTLKLARSNLPSQEQQPPLTSQVQVPVQQEIELKEISGQSHLPESSETNLFHLYTQIIHEQTEKVANSQQDLDKQIQTPVNQQDQKMSDVETTPCCEQRDPILEEACKQQAHEKLNKDLQAYTDRILNHYETLLPYRMLVFNRIQFVVRNLFASLHADIRLFGSCATGLALPDSDIDLSVLGFELFPKTQLQGPMNALQDCLNTMRWVTSTKAILSSSIPVLKLDVNPKIAMEESIFGRGFNFYPLLPESTKQLNLSTTQIHTLTSFFDKHFKVDISFNQVSLNFDNPEHLGQVTTEMVLEWIQKRQELQSLVILMKAIFKSKGLNQSYLGGLSSFSVVLMVHAFLVHRDLTSQSLKGEGLGKIFLAMVAYYGNEFNPSTTGINYITEGQRYMTIHQNNSPFYPLNYQNTGITILSPLSNKSITGSCQYIHNIFADFRDVLKEFNVLAETFYEYSSLRKKKRIRKAQQELFNNKLKINFMEQMLTKVEKLHV